MPETQAELSVNLESDADVSVIGDAGRMEQVLTNLVTNAIKFSPGGRVTLTAQRNPSEIADFVDLSFIVTDTGIGIPPEKREQIFEPFRQLEQGLGRSHEGVGLGLYIVKNISDLMYADLKVTDNPGGGTVFTWRVQLLHSPTKVISRTHRPWTRSLCIEVCSRHCAAWCSKTRRPTNS